MRFFISIISISLLIIGCSSKTENLTLSGTVKGLKKGTLYLQKFEDDVLISVDSLIIDGNSDFVFHQNLEEPEVYYLWVKPKDGSLKDDRVRFFAEPGMITINTVLDKFGSQAQISGSANDSILRVFNKLKQRFIEKNLGLIEERLKLQPGSSDSLILANENRQQRLLSNQYYTTVNFAINNKEFEVSPYLMLTEAPYVNVKYLDTVYNSLDSKIKSSKYGKELELYIQSRKTNDSL